VSPRRSARRSPGSRPFGTVERPTHRSRPRDWAQFEVPGHRFAAIEETGFGVALLTDSKYGYSAEGGVLGLSLLRAPTDPDPDADQGAHAFAYAILPHAGAWHEAGVVAAARRFNHPGRWGPPVSASGRPLARCDDRHLVLDTIKPAEDSDATVLRLYEAHGARGTAEIRLDPPPSAARRATLLEEPGEPMELRRDGGIVVPYGPHEVVTILV
jgi:alpha-mannosidase